MCTLNFTLIQTLIFVGEAVDLVLWSILTSEREAVEVPRVAELFPTAPDGRAPQGQGVTSLYLLRLGVFHYLRRLQLLLLLTQQNPSTSCMPNNSSVV